MLIGIKFLRFCNRILLASGVFVLLALCARPMFAQTTNWTGLGTRPNVWSDTDNWSPNAPSTNSIAVIESGGTGSILFLRSGTNGIVDSGTIIFAHESYRNIIGGTGGATVGVINFGTSAFLDVDVPILEGVGGAKIGDVNGSGTANVIFAVPTGGSLTIRPMYAMDFNASIVGTGSITFSSLIRTSRPLRPSGRPATAASAAGPRSRPSGASACRARRNRPAAR